ncbi:DUF4405 domain-containing protein [Faecalitalea cylindroides]|uniref:DUF4405 domain-containing protein n=1 Tax=Faecalitalea cylindroides TaxID=39483 RepID=UPI00195C31CD|nr:DUF4405 domain-containing protein [Faecalitalea cylindroides]MBM6653543.1 DUF4405 domain-containing protein [Faecalitalea cylindroides]
MKKTVNMIMLLSLIVVLISGLLLKPMPITSIRILHVVSGFVFVISAIVHMQQNHMFKNEKTQIKQRLIMLI